MPRASRSAGVPEGTRSGDGRHRPATTRVIVAGIGPSRPDRNPLGVRNPAPASPDHGHDPLAPDAERTRGTRTPQTVRGVRLSMGSGNRTHSRSVFGNGEGRPSSGERRASDRPVAPVGTPPWLPAAVFWSVVCRTPAVGRRTPAAGTPPWPSSVAPGGRPPRPGRSPPCLFAVFPRGVHRAGGDCQWGVLS